MDRSTGCGMGRATGCGAGHDTGHGTGSCARENWTHTFTIALRPPSLPPQPMRECGTRGPHLLSAAIMHAQQ
eukprot:366369-Chlamydomonas_euryale.AAC.6